MDMGEFVLKEISMTLDPESIQNAIDQVNMLSKDLKDALDALVKHLLEKGVNIARLKLKRFLTGTQESSGNLATSIRVEMENGKAGVGYLCAGYPGDHESGNAKWENMSYAVFFEFGFGTGSYYYKQNQGGRLIRNQESIDKNVAAGNIDASRTQGRTKEHPRMQGNYKDAEEYKIMSRPNEGEFFGWVYKDKDGKFHVSKGQNPKPFMYNTLMFLTADAEDYGAGYIAEYISSRGA